MQIIINPDQTTTKVWELIELQGTLQFTQSHVNEFGVLDLSNVCFALFLLLLLKDVPTLKIGPTILEGKSVKLQKPFALIEKDEVYLLLSSLSFLLFCSLYFIQSYISLLNRSSMNGMLKG